MLSEGTPIIDNTFMLKEGASVKPAGPNYYMHI